MTSKEYRELSLADRPEDIEQIEVVEWMRKNNVLHYAIPNGGKRHFKTASDLKKQGVSAGVPDLCIPIPNDDYHGLYIEMKRRPKILKNGKKSYTNSSVSKTQSSWIGTLNAFKYYAAICYGSDEAIKVIKEYLENK